MVATNFEGLVGYRTLRDEGQAPLKAYDCVFGRDFQVCVCIATYGTSVPSLHTESTDSVMYLWLYTCTVHAICVKLHLIYFLGAINWQMTMSSNPIRKSMGI